MSRIGKLPITIPAGVIVEVNGRQINVKGPIGELQQPIFAGFTIEQADGKITIVPKDDVAANNNFYGLLRTLIFNMVTGVSAGFERQLEIKGVGYRGQMQGSSLILNLGFSHPITIDAPEGVTLAVANNTQITISGYDKQKVGAIAAEIRALKKPEPYKGKGIMYAGERIRRKAGKTAAKGTA